MTIFKRTQRKYAKKAYRLRNWREYEAGLRDRGSLTVWLSLTDGKLVNWDAPRPRRRKPGRQRKYSNHAIETAVTLGMVFHLSSRQGEGLLRSSFALLKLDHDVPDHTTTPRGARPSWVRSPSTRHRIGLQQTEQRRDNVPSLQGHRGLSDATRGLAAQRVEARIGCKILNTMTALGMPDSDMIG